MNCVPLVFLMGAIASEGARQPFDAQVDIARAARNVLCDYNAESYLTGLGMANRALAAGNTENHHYRAYYDQSGFDEMLRNRWMIAAWWALNESPQIAVSHFVRADSNPAWWGRACSEEWVSGDHRFCR